MRSQLDTNAPDDNLPEPTKLHLALIEAMDKGMTPPQIAKIMAKGDERKAKRLREKLRKMLANDPVLKRAIMQHAQGTLMAGLPGATAAAVKRSHRGRMDAIRFVSESTGFHNPRVQHEHSGDIKITVDIPRPKFADTESVADDMDEIED
jgi:hypothetical protein